MIKTLARRLYEFLTPYLVPSKEELVSHLVVHTASLELKKGDAVYLAPIKGTQGPFTLTGNSLPCFIYRVFDKKIMEFVLVRVEISRPSRIEFVSTIESDTAPERHGEVIETKAKFKEPFHRLSRHLYEYFPLVPKEGAHSV